MVKQYCIGCPIDAICKSKQNSYCALYPENTLDMGIRKENQKIKKENKEMTFGDLVRELHTEGHKTA